MVQTLSELAPTLGLTAACRALGVPRSSYYRTQRLRALRSARLEPARREAAGVTTVGAGTITPRRAALALLPGERAAVRDLLASDRFADLWPREV